MARHFYSRLVAMLLLVIPISLWIAHDVMKKHLMGREGYLQLEGHYFDKHLANYSHPSGHAISYAIFFTCGFALYELTSCAINKAFFRKA